MFDSIAKMWTKQPEQQQQMNAEPSGRSNVDVVAQQPTAGQHMTTDPSKMEIRGGGEGEGICCGICAGLACFECCEICC